MSLKCTRYLTCFQVTPLSQVVRNLSLSNWPNSGGRTRTPSSQRRRTNLPSQPLLLIRLLKSRTSKIAPTIYATPLTFQVALVATLTSLQGTPAVLLLPRRASATARKSVNTHNNKLHSLLPLLHSLTTTRRGQCTARIQASLLIGSKTLMTVIMKRKSYHQGNQSTITPTHTTPTPTNSCLIQVKCAPIIQIFRGSSSSSRSRSKSVCWNIHSLKWNRRLATRGTPSFLSSQNC